MTKPLFCSKKLYNKSNNAYYYNYYLQCLLQLNMTDQAEKIVKRRIKKENNPSKYKVDLGYIYLFTNQLPKANKEFDNAINELQPDNQQIFDLANAFILRNKPEYAVKTYLKARELLTSNQVFNIELSDLYLKTGDYQNMLNELLSILEGNNSLLELVQNKLQYFISFDNDNSKTDIVRKALLKKIQSNPSKTIFNELLLWLSIQQKNFPEALLQAKALDRTYKENGERILNLAHLCVSNNEFDVAIQAFDYLISKNNESPFYAQAVIEKAETKYQKFLNTYNTDKASLELLEQEFKDIIKLFGKNQLTVHMIKSPRSSTGFRTF